jgi:lysyl-tRNA synthetase, class I
MTPTFTAWPFKEASSLEKRFQEQPASPVTFETGFGPSGLPHIGTFAEVVRTTWVRKAFESLTGWPTQLIAFSDDVDGLRKVPLNMPQREMLAEHIGKPLYNIPDPFGLEQSYSAHMNRKLQEMLNAYSFDYRFQSSYEAYQRGDFDEGLGIILQQVDEIRAIIVPTLGEEKQDEWSPFFPICENCGRIYSTRVTGYQPEGYTLDYVCDRTTASKPGCGYKATTSVFGGRVKVGWKVDWALRWYSYDVAYEMYGKDLIESAKLSGRIVRLMGKRPPNGFFYELFLDETGQKISKSVGKGLTVETWMMYAPLESLLYFLFQKPNTAKRLSWDMVPQTVDKYLEDLVEYQQLAAEKRPDSPIWHIFDQGWEAPSFASSISFSMIDNLVSALGSDDAELVLDYLEKYDPAVKTHETFIRDLVKRVINYYKDFVLPNKNYRFPTEQESRLLRELRDRVRAYPGNNEQELQSIPFDVAKTFGVPPNMIFQAFYQVLLGQERGPRFGTFASLVGKEKIIQMLDTAVDLA